MVTERMPWLVFISLRNMNNQFCEQFYKILANLRFARPKSEWLFLAADWSAWANPAHMLESKMTIWMRARLEDWCLSANLRTTSSITAAMAETFRLKAPIYNNYNITTTQQWATLQLQLLQLVIAVKFNT